jgi:hypothetical protein
VAGAWDLVEPPAEGCLHLADYRPHIPVPDGWLVVGAGAPGDEIALWAVRPAGRVGFAARPAGSRPTPPASAIPEPPTAPLPTPADCPADPVTIEAIVGLSPYDRAACFGSRKLTFRAWVVDPGEGYGGTCAPTTPRWLQPCVLPDWWLAADRTYNAGSEEDHHVIGAPKVLDALKSPGATGDLKGVGRWVEVTGHFDDPAAATCHTQPGPAGIGQPPLASLVLQCREQFAVTRIETTR